MKNAYKYKKKGKKKTQKKTGRENEPVIYPTYYDLWLLSCKGRRVG